MPVEPANAHFCTLAAAVESFSDPCGANQPPTLAGQSVLITVAVLSATEYRTTSCAVEFATGLANVSSVGVRQTGTVNN